MNDENCFIQLSLLVELFRFKKFYLINFPPIGGKLIGRGKASYSKICFAEYAKGIYPL